MLCMVRCAWSAVHDHGGDFRSEWDMPRRVKQPCAYACAYACAMVGDDVVAVGRTVADTGWAEVFGMATLLEARGKGAAHNVLAALADWAAAYEADRDNILALWLYERTGFSEICGYRFRAAR
jgi:GNAT superfamily N-acetyltransferase